MLLLACLPLLGAPTGLPSVAVPRSLPSQPLHGQAPPAQLIHQVIYDQLAAPGSPEEIEAVANLIYPVAKGPASLGYPVEPLPVFLSARGGNSNNFEVGELKVDQAAEAASGVGLVGVSFNYPIVDPSEDYNVAAAGVGMLVQHLRANAADYNIDPNQIFLMGRSFGAVVGHAVSLKENHQDLGSPNTDAHFDSRPDYWIPRFGPSDLTCFPTDTSSWSSIFTTFWFPDQTFAEGTPEQRLEHSPFWWLLRPDLHQRERTAPMCVVYLSIHDDQCGVNTDPHSGLFGDLLLDAMEAYADQSGDRTFLERSSSVSSSIFPDPTANILAWVTRRLGDDFDGLFLLPPTGEVALGEQLNLQIAGGTPGSNVTFFTGSTAGTFPMPGCPELLGQITDFTQLGTSVVSNAGVASLSFDPGPGVVGQTGLFHAVDFNTCEMSNLSVHVFF